MARHSRWLACAVAVAFGAAAVPGHATPSRQAMSIGPQPCDALIAKAYRAAYSLDYDEALAAARQAVAVAPDEPRTHRTLAMVVWQNIMFQRGAITVDAFLGGMARAQATFPKPSPVLEAEFKKESAAALALAQARLKANPKDLDARYDAGAAYALQASYAASVENSVTAAFGSARHAYDDHEEVLDKNPRRADAGLVVGTYRYIVSIMSLPTRLFAYIAGFGGDKQKGITLLEAANREPATHMEAAIALVLIYTREQRLGDAVTLLRPLEQEYPRNRIFVMEEGAAAIRAGKPAEAEAALSRGWAAYPADSRPKIPGEGALWLYKRGLARAALNRTADALVDLNGALDLHPVDWVRGRIHLELGKIADLSANRPGAIAEYQLARTACEAVKDAACGSDAGKYLKKPYAGPGK